MRLYYTLKTIDPIVISQTTATTNNHQCLDYIPGSAILGAVASRYYSQLDAEQSWQMFHTGELRFSPCYPTTQNEIALPMPASWQHAKGSEVFSVGTEQLIRENILQSSDTHTTQLKQIRSGYITSTGERATVQQGIVTKTAIERENKDKERTMTAKDGSLFSYAYISSDQVFAGWIDSENEALLTTIRDFFDHNTIRLGRSRSAEFGRVQLTSSSVTNSAAPHQADNKLTLWCLSDCELENAQGLATYQPSASDIHASLSGQLNRSESAILTEQVSRFNRTRGGLDSAQALIKRGSVLVFNLDEKATPEALIDIENQGIGRNRQQGLGWVVANPTWSMTASLPVDSQPLFNAVKIERIAAATEQASANTKLTAWLSEQVETDKQTRLHTQKIEQCLREVISFYRRVRSYKAIVPQHEIGPSRSQWERIDAQLRMDSNTCFAAVFEGQNRIAKAENDEYGWGAEWFIGSVPTNFEQAVYGVMKDLPIECWMRFLERLCRYDLSQSKDLKRIEKELGLTAMEASV